jgi:hypothetical protein
MIHSIDIIYHSEGMPTPANTPNLESDIILVIPHIGLQSDLVLASELSNHQGQHLIS